VSSTLPGGSFCNRSVSSSSETRVRVAATCSAFFFFHAIAVRETANVTAAIRWLSAAEAVSRTASSASCYHFVENISIVAIVEQERKLVEIDRQVFFRDVMEVADDAALQQGPERLLVCTLPRTYTLSLC
jgi:hypothetical protein